LSRVFCLIIHVIVIVHCKCFRTLDWFTCVSCAWIFCDDEWTCDRVFWNANATFFHPIPPHHKLIVAILQQ
jgi:hypothetical protein